MRRLRIAAAAVVAILAVAPFLFGLPGEFVYDDHRLIVDNDGLKRPFAWSRAFGRDYYASDLDRMGLGYYRPVALLANEFDYRRGGGAAAPFHATNIALHIAASLAVLALGIRLLGGRVVPAAVAASLFALHPAHAESVAFISGRVDLLATLFSLVAVAAHLRANRGSRAWVWRALAGLAFFLALLSKEMAVTAPVIVVLLEWAEEGRPRRATIAERLGRYAPWIAAAVVYLPMRLAALGGLFGPETGEGVGGAWRPLVAIGSYLAWLVVPPPGLHLEPDPVHGVLAVAASGLVFAAVAAAAYLWRQGARTAGALVLATLIALLPVAQLRAIETALSERFLYGPSAWACLAVAVLSARIAQTRVRRAVYATAAVLGVVYAAILVPRAQLWRDEVALWTAKESETGGSLKARINLGRALARDGRLDDARAWYAKAIAMSPDLTAALRGEMASVAGQAGESEAEAMERALASAPEDAGLWNNLGFVRLRAGDLPQAAAAFERSVTITPLRATPWLGLALVKVRNRDYAGAEAAARRAADLDPALGLARAVLAECALKQGRPCEALAVAEGVALEEPGEASILARILEAARGSCRNGLPN